MGKYVKPPYKRLNKETGRWELITPEPIEFTKETSSFNPVEVRTRRVKVNRKDYKQKKK